MAFGPFQRKDPDEKRIARTPMVEETPYQKAVMAAIMGRPYNPRDLFSPASCGIKRAPEVDDSSDELTASEERSLEPGDVDNQKEQEDFAGDADPRQWEASWDDQ